MGRVPNRIVRSPVNISDASRVQCTPSRSPITYLAGSRARLDVDAHILMDPVPVPGAGMSAITRRASVPARPGVSRSTKFEFGPNRRQCLTHSTTFRISNGARNLKSPNRCRNVTLAFASPHRRRARENLWAYPIQCFERCAMCLPFERPALAKMPGVYVRTAVWHRCAAYGAPLLWQ